MSPTLSALIALQALDSAAEALRKRLADMPAAEQALSAAVSAARASVEAEKARIQENTLARRALEKDIAGVDTRLARFDDLQAASRPTTSTALSTNSTAKEEKNASRSAAVLMGGRGRWRQQARPQNAHWRKRRTAAVAPGPHFEADRATIYGELTHLLIRSAT